MHVGSSTHEQRGHQHGKPADGSVLAATYYTQALQTGQNLTSGSGPAYYPGTQVAPLNSMQESGLTSIQNAAMQPNATTGAENANQFETSGALLNPSSNPYLQQTFQQGANAVQNSALDGVCRLWPQRHRLIAGCNLTR